MNNNIPSPHNEYGKDWYVELQTLKAKIEEWIEGLENATMEYDAGDLVMAVGNVREKMEKELYKEGEV